MRYVARAPKMRAVPASALPHLPRSAARIVTARDDSAMPRSKNRNEISTPGRTRTCDPRLRRPLLYPTELRARQGSFSMQGRCAGKGGLERCCTESGLSDGVQRRPRARPDGAARSAPATRGLEGRCSIQLSYGRVGALLACRGGALEKGTRTLLHGVRLIGRSAAASTSTARWASN